MKLSILLISMVPSFAAAVVLIDRYQAELEAKVLESEIAIQVTSQVEARVQEVMASQAVQQSLQERLIRERKLLEEQVGPAWLWVVIKGVSGAHSLHIVCMRACLLRHQSIRESHAADNVLV